jgi:hypothetical protein
MQRYHLVDAVPRIAFNEPAASSSLTRRRDLDALQRDLLIAVRPGNPAHTTGYDFVNLTGARLCLPGLGAS